MKVVINNKDVYYPSILSCIMTNSTQYAEKRKLLKPEGVMFHCSDRPYPYLR